MTDKKTPHHKDGILLDYIEGFYQATDDHERALYGAYIVGSLEAMFSNYLENLERKEE